MEKYAMVAKTFQGLEEVLAQELIRLGAGKIEIGQRMVSFEGDLKLMYQANLCLRTALRVLKPIAKFSAEDTDELYDRLRDIDWREYFLSPDRTFVVDATVNSSRFTHSQFVAYRVKDAIVDFFQEKVGRRPSVSVDNADIYINIHIQENRVTISLDSSGEPLSRRGYKVEQTEAPINEVLAAGILLTAGWNGDVDFLDPMCGSGTFLTEAAMIAANINPGIYRKHFAFENWDDFDQELFEDLYNDDSAEREVNVRIMGGDKDSKAVAIAKRNIRSAKLENIVSVEWKPMEEWTDNPPEGLLVTNPPYGQRLRPGNMDSLWKMIGTCLKFNFQGWHAWIIGMTDEQFAEIGLKPSKKVPLHNGSLECSLREYILFAGRYNDMRASGGSIGHSANREENLRGIARGRHLSDREWKEETKRYGGSKPRRFRDDREEQGRGRGPKKGGFDSKRGGSDSKRGGFSPKRNGEFESRRGGYDSRKGENSSRRGKDSRDKGYRDKSYKVADKGPQLTDFQETRFYEKGMRPRKRPARPIDIDDED